MHGFRGLLLGDDFARVEFDEHRAVSLDLFDRHTKPEVVQKQELQFQVVKLGKWQSADLDRLLVNCFNSATSVQANFPTFAYLEFV